MCICSLITFNVDKNKRISSCTETLTMWWFYRELYSDSKMPIEKIIFLYFSIDYFFCLKKKYNIEIGLNTYWVWNILKGKHSHNKNNFFTYIWIWCCNFELFQNSDPFTSHEYDFATLCTGIWILNKENDEPHRNRASILCICMWIFKYTFCENATLHTADDYCFSPVLI